MNAHTPISEDFSETARFVNLDRRLNRPFKSRFLRGGSIQE